MTPTPYEVKHQQFFGRPPTSEQVRLYGAAPKRRGFRPAAGLTEQQEAELFEAVFTLGLSFCVAESKPVYIFVPPDLEGWALKKVGGLAADIMQTCKRQKQESLRLGNALEAEYANTKARRFGQLFQLIRVGSKVGQGTTPPDHWTAYGFDEGEDVPRWLTDALLPTYSFGTDE